MGVSQHALRQTSPPNSYCCGSTHPTGMHSYFIMNFHYYCLPTKLLEGNVFNCVCMSVCSQWSAHVTITHDALCLSVQGPTPIAPGHQTWDSLKLTSLLVTPAGHHWKPFQTCSLKDPLLVMTSGGYRSTHSWQAGGTHIAEMLSCFVKTLFPLFLAIFTGVHRHDRGKHLHHELFDGRKPRSVDRLHSL